LSDATASEDATAWHRRFAAASNNRAWDLSVRSRSTAEDQEMREYFLRVGAPDWETAFVHVVHAHAASAAGEAVKHGASYESAVAALERISSEEERRIVASTFSHVPKP
jgi:hypothetical protein